MKKNNLIKLIGILVFGYILYRVDVLSLLKLFKEIGFADVLIIIPLFFVVIILKTLRWSFILKSQDITLPIMQLYRAYLSSVFFGAITPGRLGEIVKYKYVQLRGHGVGVSISSAIGDRVWDLFFLTFVGWIGLPFLYPVSVFQYTMAGVVALSVVTGIILVRRFKDKIKTTIRALLNRFYPSVSNDSINIEVNEFFDILLPSNIKHYAVVLILTLLSWIVYFFQSYLLASLLGIEIGFIRLSLVIAAAALITILPISFMGIGTRDAVFILLLSPLGVTTEQSVALSLGMLLLFFSGIILSAPFWFAQPIDSPELKGEMAKKDN